MSLFPAGLHRSLPLCLALACASLSAQAGKPDWVEDGPHGKGRHKSEQRSEHRGDDRRGDDRRSVSRESAPAGMSVQIQVGGYFRDDHRHSARAYYEPRVRSGRCPRGLAKKHNGCMPPGQVRHWHRGEPLSREVVYYPVPAAVQVRLGVPPAGHKFVRVASDILLIAVGTGLVIDAIEDLGGL